MGSIGGVADAPVTAMITQKLVKNPNDLYRFGFNGMEKVNEIFGRGTHYDFGARYYDARVGRWLSVDPISQSYPWISSYVFANNSPILYGDGDGRIITIFYATGAKDTKGQPIIKQYNYGSKMQVPDNEFVKQTVDALNHIKAVDKVTVYKVTDYNPTPATLVTKLSNDPKVKVNIRETTLGDNRHRPIKASEESDILFHPTGATRLLDMDEIGRVKETGVSRPAAGALNHELKHAFDNIYFNSQYENDIIGLKDNPTNYSESAFPNAEEKKTSTDYDNGYLEYYKLGERTGYDIQPYEAESSTSTKPSTSTSTPSTTK